jgi:hypothetical protein
MGSGGGGGGGGGIPEAPTDGKIYGRKNSSWTAVETARYRHTQATAAAVWNVQHNLGTKPVSVWTFDAAGNQVFGDPDYAGATLNLLQVFFAMPLTGVAFIHTLF